MRLSTPSSPLTIQRSTQFQGKTHKKEAEGSSTSESSSNSSPSPRVERKLSEQERKYNKIFEDGPGKLEKFIDKFISCFTCKK